MPSTLFEFAVVFSPTEAEIKAGTKPAIIVDRQMVLAKDLSGATMLAARAIPEEWADRLDQLTVACRPF